MKKTITKSLIAAFVIASAPTLIACDGGEKKEEVAKKDDAKKDDGAEKKEEEKPVDPAAQKEADETLGDAAMASLDPKVAKAVNIAKEIEADPSKADEILAKHELNREGLDALMYEIARSPELAKSYAAARMNS